MIFLEVNVEDGNLADNIRNLPTFQFFKNGEILHELVGANKEELELRISQFSKVTEALADTQESDIPDNYSVLEENFRVMTLISFELLDENNEYVRFDQLGILDYYIHITLSLIHISEPTRPY